MRARIVLFSALLLMGGCRTPGTRSTGTLPLTLTATEKDTAAALAHFALGSFYEMDEGANALDTIHAFEDAATYDPSRHRIRSKIALGYLMRRQPSKAITVLEESCRRNPDKLDPLIDLAVTCQIAGKLDQAIDCLTKAIALAPTESSLYTTEAKIHIHRSDDDAAIEVLRRGLRAAYSNELCDLVSARGSQLLGTRDLKGALRYFMLLRDEGRDMVTPALLNLIGQIHLEAKQPEQAAAAFAEAASRHQPPPETFTKLGATQMFLGRKEAAVASLEKGRALYPRNTRLLFSLALAYNTMGRAEEGYQTLSTIRQMSELNPTAKLSRDFYITYGATADHTGRLWEAEAAFTTCLQLYPDADQALNYLAYRWADSNQNLDQAMDYVTQALKIKPENAAYLDTLAWIYYRQGDYAAARDELTKALETMPDDPTINEHMGDVYDALDAPAKARHYWTRSVMADPDNRWVVWKLEAAGGDSRAILRRARKARKRKIKNQD